MSSARILFTCVVVLGVFNSTDSASLRCYMGSLDSYEVTPLNSPSKLLKSPCMNLTIPTVFYTFGYRGKVAGPATTAMMSAYLGTKKRNVILVDWEAEASSGLLGIPLGYALSAMPKAKQIGEQLGDAIAELAKSGLDTNRVHLLGHSLGAHVMGYAGRRARAKGYVVGRITGLDPARALYESSFSLQAGLDRTCAKFVDIIHSDPGGYGTSKPAGTVDFWPNYDGSGSTQPGCPNGDYDMFTKEDLCRHDRSWRYFSEAIASPTSFMAELAESYEDWRHKDLKRHAPIYTYMGDLVSIKARGNFYLTTHSRSPYGAGEKGLRPDENQAKRSRRNSSITRFLRYFR